MYVVCMYVVCSVYVCMYVVCMYAVCMYAVCVCVCMYVVYSECVYMKPDTCVYTFYCAVHAHEPFACQFITVNLFMINFHACMLDCVMTVRSHLVAGGL